MYGAGQLSGLDANIFFIITYNIPVIITVTIIILIGWFNNNNNNSYKHVKSNVTMFWHFGDIMTTLSRKRNKNASTKGVKVL